MKKYVPRIYDSLLQDQLQIRGAVLVEGPKWCGKTTTAAHAAGSVLYLQDPRTKEQNLRLATLAPHALLGGPVPRLIDEWQMAPKLWDSIRFEVDQRGEFGQFILTGSAVPANMDELAHTGTGRIGRMKMRPMSLLESGDSSGGVSLAGILHGRELPVSACEDGIESLARITCRGGWPAALQLSERLALKQAQDYVDEVCASDASRVDDVERNPQLVRAILRSYARMVASQGSIAAMAADVSASGFAASEKTVRDYVAALTKIFVIEDLAAWSPNLRSKTAIRTAPTRHFVDPSVAVAALGAGSADLIGDLNTFGLLFESLCIRDLRIYADYNDGNVYHYRDKSGLECDAVVHLRNGSYALFEVKLGGDGLIDEGAKSLKKLAAKLDTSRMPEPSALVVLTGTGGFSYTREDGVHVVPIRCLAP